MIFGFAILATALLLSAVAAWYSVAGLTAIFSAATIPVIIMGGSLELGKIVATVWLHNNWRRAGILFKLYLIPAVAFLMLLTSMGIFGYLSKAHSDQSLVSGDAVAKVAIYDEKIKTAKDNIDANRRALKQMDEAVDQVMGRSSDEKGADKAVAIRRGQAKERTRLLSEITAEQKLIAQLSEERAPLAAEFRKVESEVGPIKYIAALVYGDNPDANVLEKAVRLVIIMIVLVFDPLALTLILASNKQFEWARQGTGGFVHDEPKYEPDDGPLTDQQIEQIRASVELPKDPHPPGWMFEEKEDERPWNERYPYLSKPFVHFENLKPMVAPDPAADDQAAMAIVPPEEIPGVTTRPWTAEEIEALNKPLEMAATALDPHAGMVEVIEEIIDPNTRVKTFNHRWVPDLSAKADDARPASADFGTQFPQMAQKGDLYLRVDFLPTKLFKFNGSKWIEVDKTITDSYAYNDEYVKYLIDKINSGEYNIDDLSETEQNQIREFLQNNQ